VSRARIGGILLAAGSARRFGSDKRFALLQAGDTLIARSARVLAQAVDECIVVVGCDDSPERFAALLPGWKVIRAENSAEGMGASLASAARVLPGEWDGCLVALADKPFVRRETALDVREALLDRIVVPCYGGEWGHPVGFPRRLFPALAALHGESGGRSLIVAEASSACFLDVDDPGVQLDIDTPVALAVAAAQFP
jgi:molybdenum cofactor cytidylyltransferase